MALFTEIYHIGKYLLAILHIATIVHMEYVTLIKQTSGVSYYFTVVVKVSVLVSNFKLLNIGSLLHLKISTVYMDTAARVFYRDLVAALV